MSTVFVLWKINEEKRLKNNILLFQHAIDCIEFLHGNSNIYHGLKRDYLNYIISLEINKRELEELKKLKLKLANWEE